MRYAVTLLAALLVGCAAPPEVPAQELVQKETIVVDGVKRKFAYFVPGGTGDAPLPVVIALHGHGGRVKGMIGKGLLEYPDKLWMDVAQREKFLVFYPQGLPSGDRKPGWNDCRVDTKANPDSDDVKFLSELVEFARKRFRVDDDRIYVSGVSNGGFMALRMALERSDMVAAVAAVVALVASRSECPERPRYPVSVLLMYGTKDRIVPARGGKMVQGRGDVYSAEESVRKVLEWDGLVGVKPKRMKLPDTDPEDGSTVEVEVYSKGGGGPEVAVYRIEGGGHNGPSKAVRAGRLISMVVGPQNHDIEMVETIWSFFRDKRRLAPRAK